MRSSGELFKPFLFVVLWLAGSCTPEPELLPEVETGAISDVTAKTARVKGRIVELGAGIQRHGHVYGHHPDPTTDDNEHFLGSAGIPYEYTSDLQELEPATTYYARAYVTSEGETYYGDGVIFTTLDGQAEVNTGSVTEITVNSAKCNGVVTSDGGDEVKSKGICWHLQSDFELAGATGFETDGEGVGEIQCDLTGLLPATSYFVKAFACTSIDTTYGSIRTFITESGMVSFNTTVITDLTNNSALCISTITSDGGAEILNRGVCYGLTEMPDLDGRYKVSGKGAGQYTTSLTGLEKATTYYVRPFAINEAGNFYGPQVQFTTFGDAELNTLAVTEIRMTTAMSGGFVSNTGGAEVTARGVCWNTALNPTTSHYRTMDGSGEGSFTSLLTGLSKNTTYYVRAYAESAGNIYYGSHHVFTTDDGVAMLTTNPVSDIGQFSATCGGSVTDDGGTEVLAKGVCWGITTNPSTGDSKTIDGSGTASFTSSLTGLAMNTKYYVRSYATNSEGTYYGNQVDFTTGQGLPEVITNFVTDITTTSAKSGGNVTGDGGSSITARGVCYGVAPDPTIDGSKTMDGSGTGSYSSALTGLQCDTKYFIRAYATNAEGSTGYGDQLTFTTGMCITEPVVVTNSIDSITENSAFGRGEVTSDGGAPLLSRGFCWSFSPDPDINDDRSEEGGGTGIFGGYLTGLQSNTTYYVRAYATNNAGHTGYGTSLNFTTSLPPNTVADIDGNVYQVVQIGSQVWMAENLKVTRYADGTSVPYKASEADWAATSASQRGYGWLDGNSAHKHTYGAFYNWLAASNGQSSSANPSSTQGICPDGWHLPSDEEWKEMEKAIGMSSTEANDIDLRGTTEGGELKETGTSLWTSPNTGATNEHGFNGRPNGYVSKFGKYEDSTIEGSWWTATEASTDNAWYRGVYFDHSRIRRNNYGKIDGFGVRCVRD